MLYSSYRDIFDAMFPVKAGAAEVIIQQGEGEINMLFVKLALGKWGRREGGGGGA